MRKVVAKTIRSAERLEGTVSAFYDALGKGVLSASKCRACGALLVPPTTLCPSCHGSRLNTIRLSGRGKLTTFTVVHIAPPELAHISPYVVGVVRLREGPSVLGILAGGGNPDDIRMGEEVVVDFESCAKLTPGTVRLVFKPAPKAPRRPRKPNR